MACGQFTVTAVPASKVQQIKDLFNANKPAPLSVTDAPDGVGQHKIVVEFPPCPDPTAKPIGS